MNSELLNQKKNKFSVFEASLATLLFVVFNFVFLESFYSFVRTVGITDLGLLFAQFLVEALFGVASVVTAYFCKVNIIKAAGMDKKINIKIVIYCVLIAFCSLILFAPLTSSFLELLGLLGYNSSSASIDVSTFAKYIGYVIAACVTPAICEELLFRGTIQSGLKKYGKWISIVSASLIFMLMHGGPEQTIHQFIVGLIVGLIFYETGNIWISVIVHFFNNFISITELFLFNMFFSGETLEESTETVESLTTAEMWSSFLINLFIAIVMACIGFVIMRALIKKVKEENQKINKNESVALEETKASVLIDGTEIETDILISNSETQNANDEVLEEGKPKLERDEIKPMDLKTKILFAIPIAWMILQWILALLSGF